MKGWDPTGNLGPKKPLPDTVTIQEPPVDKVVAEPTSEHAGAADVVAAAPVSSPRRCYRKPAYALIIGCGGLRCRCGAARVRGRACRGGAGCISLFYFFVYIDVSCSPCLLNMHSVSYRETQNSACSKTLRSQRRCTRQCLEAKFQN